VSASQQANAFCREVLVSGEVFLIEHERNGPVDWPLAGTQHARPIWSSHRRVVRMLEGPLAARGLVIVASSWEHFCERIAPETELAGLLIGLNWSGPRARGYNLPPADVIARVDAVRARVDAARDLDAAHARPGGLEPGKLEPGEPEPGGTDPLGNTGGDEPGRLAG
jgi:hypothetical protein